MSEPSRQRLHSVPEKNVRIRHIPRELDAIWTSLHADLKKNQAVTRACMSNLIVYCDDDAQTADVYACLPDLVLPHPSRVILLTGLGYTTEPGLDVFVSGLYSKQSSGIQVCAELVRVIADETARGRLPPVARSQIVGDLPTTLWWASHEPAPFLGDLFHQLTSIADQIIYDNRDWVHPAQGMQAMSPWVAAQSSEYVIYNLAWRRLKYWRALISQVLDPAIHPQALRGVTELTIQHGPHAVSMASLLVGWFAYLLKWQVADGKSVPGKVTVWEFTSSAGNIAVTLERIDNLPSAHSKVSWKWRDDEGEHQAVFADLGDERLRIVNAESDVPLSILSAPDSPLGTMVSAQMAHRERDLVFEGALATGNSMTAVLLK